MLTNEHQQTIMEEVSDLVTKHLVLKKPEHQAQPEVAEVPPLLASDNVVESTPPTNEKAGIIITKHLELKQPEEQTQQECAKIAPH
jgi:hypothetical protein